MLWPKFAVLCQPLSTQLLFGVGDIYWNKTFLFCVIPKFFLLGNILFNSASRRWILITSGKYFLTLNKRAWNMCLILHSITPQGRNNSPLFSLCKIFSLCYTSDANTIYLKQVSLFDLRSTVKLPVSCDKVWILLIY